MFVSDNVSCPSCAALLTLHQLKCFLLTLDIQACNQIAEPWTASCSVVVSLASSHNVSCIPQLPHQTSGIYTPPPFFDHTAADRPTTRTHFADRAFRCSAPAVWNSLNTDTLCCSSLAVFKRSLKTFLFRQTFRPSSSCIARL